MNLITLFGLLGGLLVLAFATIFLTNLIVIFGSVRVRRTNPAEPAGFVEPAKEAPDA